MWRQVEYSLLAHEVIITVLLRTSTRCRRKMMGMARTDADDAGEAASSDTSVSAGSRTESRVTPRGEDRRQTIIEAAAAIIRESGPSAISHRSVAKRAGCSLSATTYYFDGLEDLLHQAGLVNIGLWASRAEHVADRVEAFKGVPDVPQRVRFILQATLPAHGGYVSMPHCAGCCVNSTARSNRRWSSLSWMVLQSPRSVRGGTSSPPPRDY